MNVVDVAFRAPRCARARGRVPPLAGERTEIAPSRDRGHRFATRELTVGTSKQRGSGNPPIEPSSGGRPAQSGSDPPKPCDLPEGFAPWPYSASSRVGIARSRRWRAHGGHSRPLRRPARWRLRGRSARRGRPRERRSATVGTPGPGRGGLLRRRPAHEGAAAGRRHVGGWGRRLRAPGTSRTRSDGGVVGRERGLGMSPPREVRRCLPPRQRRSPGPAAFLANLETEVLRPRARVAGQGRGGPAATSSSRCATRSGG